MVTIPKKVTYPEAIKYCESLAGVAYAIQPSKDMAVIEKLGIKERICGNIIWGGYTDKTEEGVFKSKGLMKLVYQKIFLLVKPSMM